MKINKYIIGLGLTFSFLFAGCDSFLDPAKDGKEKKIYGMKPGVLSGS